MDGDEPCPPGIIKSRILAGIGAETDIYSGLGDSYYRPPHQSVAQVIDDIFEFRNRLVHGAWAPSAWVQPTSNSAFGSTWLARTDVPALRRQAGTLRAGLKKKLSAL